MPSNFETRNAGLTLEVEPVVSDDGKQIHLNLVPQHVHFRGMRTTTIQQSVSKEKITVDQPIFQTMKTQTSLTLKNGGRMLLGVFPTDEPPDHVELFILHAEIREP
jgi:general secretion pathway protein D